MLSKKWFYQYKLHDRFGYWFLVISTAFMSFLILAPYSFSPTGWDDFIPVSQGEDMASPMGLYYRIIMMIEFICMPISMFFVIPYVFICSALTSFINPSSEIYYKLLGLIAYLLWLPFIIAFNWVLYEAFVIFKEYVVSLFK